jgi:hypothetical protein
VADDRHGGMRSEFHGGSNRDGVVQQDRIESKFPGGRWRWLERSRGARQLSSKKSLPRFGNYASKHSI